MISWFWAMDSFEVWSESRPHFVSIYYESIQTRKGRKTTTIGMESSLEFGWRTLKDSWFKFNYFQRDRLAPGKNRNVILTNESQGSCYPELLWRLRIVPQSLETTSCTSPGNSGTFVALRELASLQDFFVETRSCWVRHKYQEGFNSCPFKLAEESCYFWSTVCSKSKPLRCKEKNSHISYLDSCLVHVLPFSTSNERSHCTCFLASSSNSSRE